jgi:hypothetical protein
MFHCSPALLCPVTLETAKCPEPLHALKVLPLTPCSHHVSGHYPAFIATTGSCANPKPSPCLGVTLIHKVFAGCCQSLLGLGLSRRYLCESFSACLDPYPGCSCGALARFFPQDNGLPDIRTRSAHRVPHTMATSVRRLFRGYSHSIIFRPADLLATPVAPTAAPLGTGQPWLLRPRLSRFVTSPSSGYANRPFRATDGRRTFTSQDSQPCRLLP